MLCYVIWRKEDVLKSEKVACPESLMKFEELYLSYKLFNREKKKKCSEGQHGCVCV